jgi:hypothetical protein
MSTFLTKKWDDDMKANLPKCPACAGEIEYGYLISKDAIYWAGELAGNKFTNVGKPVTGPFKKPLGVSMARCSKCKLMITVYPPE